MSQNYNDLTDFLLKHRATDKSNITHTRMEVRMKIYMADPTR